MKRSYILFLITILLLNFWYCGKKPPELQTVAQVGKEKITFREFIMDFTLFPEYRPNSTLKQARLEHLNHMIDRLLMWKAALKVKLDTLEEIQNHLNYIRQKETLKYMYEKEILDKISVSDDEAWDEYKRENLQVHLRHLYAPTREKALEYKRRLQSGETFQQLAREVFKDSTLANNGGDMGFVPLQQLDPLLADSVYHAHIGRIEGPYRSSFGYHIIKVEDVKQSLFLSRQDFLRRKKQFVKAVKKRKAIPLTTQFLSHILIGKSVTIKTNVFNTLFGISQKTIHKPRKESPLVPDFISDLEIDRLSDNLKKFLDTPLVIFSGGQWTVGEFLSRVKQTPPLQRPAFNDRERLVNQIIDMVKDELLLREAYRRGYQNAAAVKKEVEKWKKQLLADEFRKRLLWKAYKDVNPSEWQRRREIYLTLKKNTPVRIFEKRLFYDVTEAQMQKKQVPIKSVIREYYVW